MVTSYQEDLFGAKAPPRKRIQTGKEALGQFFTAEWAAEELFRWMEPMLCQGNLGKTAIICEPSCGKGAMLKAIPKTYRAFGVEIDPELAQIAAIRSGREVVQGDFRTCQLPEKPTAFFGNPPFQTKVFQGFLERAEACLPNQGVCGFILPVYFFQTANTTLEYAKRWEISFHLLPRELFHRLSVPILFALMKRTKTPQIRGVLLFEESQEINGVKNRGLLQETGDERLPWIALVEDALLGLGGEAELKHLYQAILPRSSKENRFPKEKIRQTLQTGAKRGLFQGNGNGVWRLASCPR